MTNQENRTEMKQNADGKENKVEIFDIRNMVIEIKNLNSRLTRLENW